MNAYKRTVVDLLKLLLFWVLLFDADRILFSIHNWDKFEMVNLFEWLQAFIYSIRLDLATASALSVLPMLILIGRYIKPGKWFKPTFVIIIGIEIILNACIHSGEINAYREWNHKLTTRVFTHLSNPDEVFKTADYSMTIWFFVYAIIEVLVGFKLIKWLFNSVFESSKLNWVKKIPLAFSIFIVFGSTFFLLLRGGIQQIPLNIDSAYYSNNHIANDLSVNSLYYFGKSYLLYNRSEIDEFIPKMDSVQADKIVKELYNYPKKHDNYIFNTKRPNIVFVIMESWSANAIGCLSDTKNATPNFDQLASQGLLFTNVFGTAGTSEIGNASIFSGYPALPEISITMQPEKHRKIHTINEDLKQFGYSSNYLFGGDLKYGNIGGYFMDHGFDVVEDEKSFPNSLKRGKLSYYDQDLYSIFLNKINKSKEPFLQCAFTGSTHSPFDQPKKKNQNFTGLESDFMNSLVYSDECLGEFMKNCKKQKWYKNTIFIFVADHGHPTPLNPNPSAKLFFRIPLLLFGEPLKNEYKGVKNEKIGSQTDIAATLLYQINGDISRYPWSKDLMNPNVPQFALHTINRGYGWISSKGNIVYQMDTKIYGENTYLPSDEKNEIKKCHAFLNQFYKDYKAL
jgi:phosphoglycerol transferase MdoB-like AlkP superfamily enzyme